MAYTIRKISNEEKRDTPDMRFFNYSSRDKQYGSFEEISDILKGKINPQKLSKYNKILILDEYSNSGESLTNTRQILKNYFANSKKKPKIHFASLQAKDKNLSLKLPELTFVDLKPDVYRETDTGIKDKYPFQEDMEKNIVQESTLSITGREEFVRNRKQLGNDIKKYVNSLKEEQQISTENIKELPKKKTLLERIVQSFSFFFYFLGVFYWL